MKAIHTLLILFLLGSVVFSQTPVDKGSILAGGSISMTADSEGDRDMSTRFSFAPVGYFFVMNNLGVGGTIQVSRYAQGDNHSTITFLIGPGARFYIKAGKLLPFVAASLSYGITFWDYGYADGSDGCFQVSAGGGLDFFVAQNVAVEPTVNLTFESYSPDRGDSEFSTRFTIGVGIAGFITSLQD